MGDRYTGRTARQQTPSAATIDVFPMNLSAARLDVLKSSAGIRIVFMAS